MKRTVSRQLGRNDQKNGIQKSRFCEYCNAERNWHMQITESALFVLMPEKPDYVWLNMAAYIPPKT